MALSVQRPAKCRRVIGKQNKQTAVLSMALEAEDANAPREVYLVTLPHPCHLGTGAHSALVVLATYDRTQVRDALLACCQAPEHDPAWLRSRPGFRVVPVEVKKMVVFREYHAPDANGVVHLHYHVALLLGQQARFMPLKRALLNKFKLASNWSCSHVGYWSTVSYGISATPHKPMRALDPAPLSWSAVGEHPPLRVAAIEATTARALDARRRHREQTAGENGKPEPRVDEIDIWPVIVQSGIRNGPDEPHAVKKLMQYAKYHCSHKVVAWLFKNEERLQKLIDKAWGWEEVDMYLSDATKPRLQQFLEARQRACVCGGRWLHHVRESLAMNRINVAELCSAVMDSLEAGRSESVQVPTLTGRFGGEGTRGHENRSLIPLQLRSYTTTTCSEQCFEMLPGFDLGRAKTIPPKP